MIYPLLRSVMFSLNAERAHKAALRSLALAERLGLSRLLAGPPVRAPIQLMGLHFPNVVGAAAGLDKNGEAVDALAALGFGHIEVGTVTPRPQPGNPEPRLFRLKRHRAIINRMGFNNDGIDALLVRLSRSEFLRRGGIVGVNIGKNADTPIERATQDYLHCLQKAYAQASYITVNISSPNTLNLRKLQQDAALGELLSRLKAEQTRLADLHGRYVPLALKIAPDLEEPHIITIADALRRHRFDAAIATNTTLSREGVEDSEHSREPGGLSGAPLLTRSAEVLRRLAAALRAEIPVIGSGGIMSGEDARARLEAGASLLQIYTGFIYRGPALIAEVAAAGRRRTPPDIVATSANQ